MSDRRTYILRKPYNTPQGLLSNVLNRVLPTWFADLIGVNPPETDRCQIVLVSEPSSHRPAQPYVHYYLSYLRAHHSGVSKRFTNNAGIYRYWESRSYGLPGMGVAPCKHFTVLSFARKRIFPETFWEREMKLFRAQRLYPQRWIVNRQKPIIYLPKGSLLKPKYLCSPSKVPSPNPVQ